MHCPTVTDLPPPPPGKTGWPWTEESCQLPDTNPEGIPWPKVSIVTPSYNQGQFLEESIRSVLLQGYPDLEYIIIDGGSTDESVDIIKKYARWLAYWVSEPDRGQSHAINKGLEKSSGQLFNWHNADDLLTVNSLESTAAAMVKYPDTSYAHGYRFAIDRESNVLYDTKRTFGDTPGFLPDLVSSISSLTGGTQPGCLMRRALVLEEGQIDEHLDFVMDRDILLRLALKLPPVYVARPVAFLREYSEAKTFSGDAKRSNERLIIARKIFSDPALPPAIKRLRHTAFAAAHRFAWGCYVEAGIGYRAVWHLCMDILYLPHRGWKQRKRVAKALLRRNPSIWLRVLHFAMRNASRVESLVRIRQ